MKKAKGCLIAVVSGVLPFGNHAKDIKPGCLLGWDVNILILELPAIWNITIWLWFFDIILDFNNFNIILTGNQGNTEGPGVIRIYWV